jgi:hypothetical protein
MSLRLPTRDFLHTFFDTPLSDMLAEGVKELVFRPGTFLASLP